MMTQPTAARLLQVARQELEDHVLPALADEQLAASVQMVQHILATLEVRADHEIAWMCEEIDQIEAVAGRVLAEVSSAPALEAALGRLADAPLASLHLHDVTARYGFGSELLSCLLDAVPAEHPRRPDVEALLDIRLAHESDIIGEFSLVGRH
jgi:hypothetical protein